MKLTLQIAPVLRLHKVYLGPIWDLGEERPVLVGTRGHYGSGTAMPSSWQPLVHVVRHSPTGLAWGYGVSRGSRKAAAMELEHFLDELEDEITARLRPI